jgi:hypothetical protein
LAQPVYYGIIRADINVNAIDCILESIVKINCRKRVHQIGGDILFVVRVIATSVKDMMEIAIKLLENVIANKIISNR